MKYHKFYIFQPNKKNKIYTWYGICKQQGKVLWKRSLGTTSKRVAEAWKRKQESNLYLPTSHIEVNKYILKDLLYEEQVYLERVYGASPHTLMAYNQYIVKFNGFCSGLNFVDEFDCNWAQKYINFLAQKLSPKSIHENVKYLRRMFERWILKKIISQNPFQKELIACPKVTQTEKPFWSEEEIQLILNTSPEFIYPFWCTLAYTGFRFSEAANLTFNDLDFQRKEITVLGKGSKIRVVPMNDLLFGVLLEEKKKFKFGLCFPQIPQSEQGCLKVLKKTLKGFTFRKTGENNHHRFRHSFASNLIRGGVNAKQVQALLGHASIRITFDTYGHLFPSDLHNAVKVLNPTSTTNAIPFTKLG